MLFCLQLDCQIVPLKCAVWSWNDFVAVKRGAAQDKTALLEYFGTVERLLAGTDFFSAHIYWNIML